MEACRRLGTNGHAEIAIDGIYRVVAHWNWPRSHPDYRHPHPVIAMDCIASISFAQGQYDAASRIYAFSRNTSPRAGWAHAQAGRGEITRNVFSEIIEYAKTDARRDTGHLGLAYAHLLLGDAEAARAAAATLERHGHRAARDTIMLWTAAATGHVDEVDAADAFTVLSVTDDVFTVVGSNRGLDVLALVPGSPLLETLPAMQPDDVVLSINGWNVHDGEALAALRAAPRPEGPMEVVVRRDEHVFAVTVEVAQVLARLRASAAAGPPVDAAPGEEVTP